MLKPIQANVFTYKKKIRKMCQSGNSLALTSDRQVKKGEYFIFQKKDFC